MAPKGFNESSDGSTLYFHGKPITSRMEKNGWVDKTSGRIALACGIIVFILTFGPKMWAFRGPIKDLFSGNKIESSVAVLFVALFVLYEACIPAIYATLAWCASRIISLFVCTFIGDVRDGTYRKMREAFKEKYERRNKAPKDYPTKN